MCSMDLCENVNTVFGTKQAGVQVTSGITTNLSVTSLYFDEDIQ